MAGRRVINPYLPAGWTGSIEIVPSVRYDLVADTPVRIGKTDPMRLWLLLGAEDTAGTVYLWPEQQTDVNGIGQPTGIRAILIHNASYPSLCQGEWYAVSRAAPTVVRVIEGRAMVDERG